MQKENYHAEGLVEISSPDPSFTTCYEWVVIKIYATDMEVAEKMALDFFNEHYNHSYQGGVWIDSRFVKLLCVSNSIEFEHGDITEVYSLHLNNFNLFEESTKVLD